MSTSDINQSDIVATNVPSSVLFTCIFWFEVCLLNEKCSKSVWIIYILCLKKRQTDLLVANIVLWIEHFLYLDENKTIFKLFNNIICKIGMIFILFNLWCLSNDLGQLLPREISQLFAFSFYFEILIKTILKAIYF